MQRPFNPEPKATTIRGMKMYEVDCRQWEAEVRALGHPLRPRFPSLAEAQAWCRTLVVDSTVGRKYDPGPVAVRSLYALYLKSIEAGCSRETVSLYRTSRTRFEAFLKSHRIEDVRDVSPSMIDLYRVELHDAKLAANTIVNYLSCVKRMFAWAIRMGYIDSNPCAQVKMPKRESKRRAFTVEEQRELLTKTKPELVPLWTLLFLTGLRRLEVARLTTDDVVLDTPAPFLHVHGKGDKLRVVPLTREAIKAVRHFLEGTEDGGKLVPFSYRSIYNTWVRERDRLKLAGELDVHSFRHTFLSWLANRGQVSLTEVAAVAGHSSVAITEVYVHRDEATLRAGMDRLDADLVSRWYQDEDDQERTQAQ